MKENLIRMLRIHEGKSDDGLRDPTTGMLWTRDEIKDLIPDFKFGGAVGSISDLSYNSQDVSSRPLSRASGSSNEGSEDLGLLGAAELLNMFRERDVVTLNQLSQMMWNLRFQTEVAIGAQDVKESEIQAALRVEQTGLDAILDDLGRLYRLYTRRTVRDEGMEGIIQSLVDQANTRGFYIAHRMRNAREAQDYLEAHDREHYPDIDRIRQLAAIARLRPGGFSFGDQELSNEDARDLDFIVSSPNPPN